MKIFQFFLDPTSSDDPAFSSALPHFRDPTDYSPREVVVSARPEELLVNTDLEGEGIKAEIVDSVFLGLNTHYFVKTETGEEAEIIQESRIDSILPPGTQVRLTLNAVKANVFDKETSLSLMRGVRNEVEV